MPTDAPLKYCIEGFLLTRVTDVLKAVGMRPAAGNDITQADVLVVIYPSTDAEKLLIDVAVELHKRVLVISAMCMFKGVEHFVTVNEFERGMLAEAAEAVAA